MPRGLFAFLISFCLVCAGCGGGGDNNAGSGTGGTPPPQNVPIIGSIAPSTANAGSPSLTITLYGSNFDQSAKVKWNGANLATDWVNASMLTAVVPAPNLSGAGAAQILVSNLQADSVARTFKISPSLAPGTWFRAVSGISNPKQMVFDSVHAKLYVTMPSTDPSAPNTIIPIDPVSGVAGVPVPAGNSPNLMSISSDGFYLWVADDGDGSVQRFLLPGLKADIAFQVPLALGGGTQQAIALEAAPATPHAVAIVAGDHNISPPGNGVYVFDDAVQRPNSIPGWGHGTNGPPINWVQWGGSDAVIYGMMGGFYKLDVNAAGLTWTQPAQGSNLDVSSGARYEKTSGLLHFANWTFDPVKNMQAGYYGGGGQGGINISGGCGAAAVNPALRRFYCVDKLMYENPRLLVFDEETYDFIGQTDLGTTITGSAQTLIPWGNAGLALLTVDDGNGNGTGGVFLIDGAAVNPNATPDVSSGSPTSLSYASLQSVTPQGAAAGGPDVTLTIKGSGFTESSLVYSNYGYDSVLALPTTYISATQLSAVLPGSALKAVGPLIIMVWDEFGNRHSTNSLVFTVTSNSGNTQVMGLNVSGLSLAWDPVNSTLYAGTSIFDGTHPNAIVSIDPTSGAILASAPVSPEPMLLDIATDSSRLFAGYLGAQAMSEFSLPGVKSPLTWPLLDPQGGGPFFAGDLKAAPASPATTAVTFFDERYSPRAQGGVVVFDDNVARGDFASGWTMPGNPGALYDTLAWSNSNTTLAAADNESDDVSSLLSFYTLNVDAGGATYSASHQNLNATGSSIHSDFGTGLIYSDDGIVASPFDGSIKGSYGASGLVVPDSSTQRVYIIGQTAAQQGNYNYTIQSFNETTFALVGSITLPRFIGVPFKMIRWGSSGLAILVYNGAENVNHGPETMLYIVKDTSFVSNAQAARSAAPMSERVQVRWSRVGWRDFVSKRGGAMGRRTTQTQSTF